MPILRMFPLIIVAFCVLPIVARSEEPASQPASQPAVKAAPEYDFAHCLNLVNECVGQENYPMARRWAKRAHDAAPNDAAGEQIESLRKRLALLGRPAPALESEAWLLGSADDLKQLHDRPVLVFFFQIIDHDALHLLNHLLATADRYRERGLKVLTVICVLEQPEMQPAEGIQRFVEANPFNHLVALDANGRKTFDAFRGAGLPMFAMIDRAGRLRYMGRYEPGTVEGWALKLCTETPKHQLPGRPIAMPASPGAVDLVEKRMPTIKSDWWLNTPNGRAPQMLGRPRVIRFFHADCDDCRMTAKGMQALYKRNVGNGLVVVGILLPNDLNGEFGFDQFAASAGRLEVDFPIAFDRGRANLKRWWTGTDPSRADETDPTFVIDQRGRARMIRSGCVFYPPSVAANKIANENFDDVGQATRKILSESDRDKATR